jgi:chromosome segregation ATPase
MHADDQVAQRAVLAVAAATFKNQLWSGGEDHLVCVTDFNTLHTVATLTLHAAPVTSILVVGKRVWTGAKDGRVVVWDPHTQTPLAQSTLDVRLTDRYVTSLAVTRHINAQVVWCAASDGHGVALVAEAPDEQLVDRDMLTGANCEIWRLRGLVSDRAAEIAALKLELRAAADDEAFEDVLRERDTLRQDLSRLVAKKVVADELLTDFRTALENADEDAVILKADLRSAQAAKEETAQLLSQAQTQLRMAEQDMDALRHELNEAAKQTALLSAERDAANTQIERLRTAAETSATRIAEIEGENVTLREQLGEFSQTQAQLQSAAREVETLQHRLNDAATQHALLSAERDAANSQVERQRASAEKSANRATALEGENEVVRERTDELSQALRAAKREIETLQLRLNDTSNQYASVSAERDAANSQLERLRDSAESGTTRVTVVEDENRVLREQISQFSQTQEKLQAAEQDVHALQRRVDVAAKQHALLLAERDAANAQVERQRTATAALEDEKEITRERTDKLSQALQAAEREIETLQHRLNDTNRSAVVAAERDPSKSQVEQSQASTDSGTARAAPVEGENKVQIDQLAQMQEKLQAAEQDVHALQRRVDVAAKQHALLLAERDAANAQVERQRTATAALEGEKEITRERTDKLSQALQAAEREIETLQHRLNDTNRSAVVAAERDPSKSQVEQSQASTDSGTARAAPVEGENKVQIDQLAQMQQKLQAAEQDICALQRRLDEAASEHALLSADRDAANVQVERQRTSRGEERRSSGGLGGRERDRPKAD